MYYLRTKSAVDPIKFTLSEKHQKKFVEVTEQVEIIEIRPEKIDNLSSLKSEKLQEMFAATETEQQLIEGQSCSMEEGCITCQG